MDRSRFIARSASAMLLTWLLPSCGSYDNLSKASGGSSSTTTSGGSSSTTMSGGSTSMTMSGGAPAASGGPSSMGGSSAAGQAGGGAGGSNGGGGGTAGGEMSSGGQVSCMDAAAAPCGGDVVGTWKSVSCPMTISGNADLGPTGLGCLMAPVMGMLTVTGTWTATADGMVMDTTTTEGTAVVEFAPECLKISGTATTCDRLNLQPLGIQEIECVENEATKGCTCTAPIKQFAGMAAISIDSAFNPPEGTTGTYTAADNKVVTTVAGVPTEYSYCVAGNALTMNLTTVTPIGTLTGPVVLQKQ